MNIEVHRQRVTYSVQLQSPLLKHKILLQPGDFELVVSDKEIIHFNKSREFMSKFFMRVFG